MDIYPGFLFKFLLILHISFSVLHLYLLFFYVSLVFYFAHSLFLFILLYTIL